jgi:hypothetical protein
MADAYLSTFFVMCHMHQLVEFNLPSNLMRGMFYSPHFTDEETEFWTGEATFPGTIWVENGRTRFQNQFCSFLF